MNTLTKKVGPLPLYAWVVIGVAGLVAGLWLKNRLAAANSSGAGSASPATSSTGTSFPDLGSAAPSGGAAGGGGSYGASDVTGAYQAGLTDANTSLGNAVSLIEQIQSAFGIGLGTSTPGDGSSPGSGGDGGHSTPEQPAPGSTTGPSSTVKSITGTTKQVVQTLVNPKTGVQFRVTGSLVEEKAKGGTWYVANRTGQVPSGLRRVG